MALNYPLYDVRTGRRLTIGPTTGAWGDTYGYPIWTPDEFHFILDHIKKMGFHVYANSHHGGINRTAHSPKSWHYVRDAKGRSLAADIGTYGDVNERNRIINELIPLLDRLGVAWHYARDGAVPSHYDHIHIDVSHWGRKGGTSGTGYGYYSTYRKQNPYTYLGGSGSKASTGTGTRYKRRTPRRVNFYEGISGPKHGIRLIQNIVGVKRDGSYGPATTKAVKALQKKLGVKQDGAFGPATARAYLSQLGPRRLGHKGRAVKLVQYIAKVVKDGSYGPATEKAVKELQATAGLTPDGVFGPASRNKLIK